jgi:hypothetical protein
MVSLLVFAYGNEAMGYDRFVCVESVAFTPVELSGGQKWVGSMSLVPQPLQVAMATRAVTV